MPEKKKNSQETEKKLVNLGNEVAEQIEKLKQEFESFFLKAFFAIVLLQRLGYN